MNVMLKKFSSSPHLLFVIISSVLILSLGATAIVGYLWQKTQTSLLSSQQEGSLSANKIRDLRLHLSETQQNVAILQAQLTQLQNQDQVKKNQELQAELIAIHDTFTKTVTNYNDILRLKDGSAKTQQLDALFAQTLTLLSDRNYASASSVLTQLAQGIAQQQALASTVTAAIPLNVKQVNDAPGNGYQRQTVKNDKGTFLVDVIAADLHSTRVQVETASPGDCGNNCPVDTLANFVAHSNGYAGVNGPYFCPASYPSCAGKTNSFDTLLMNRHKVYFNSANNVYSIVPLVVFSGASARFITHSQDWGRDTGADAVIAGQPLLLSNGSVAFGGDGDPKKNSKTVRAFIGNKGSTVYIGSVHGASVVETAYVLQTMGLQNALNLDDAGSMALYLNGRYLNGPGRSTPFGIVLVRK